MMIRDIFRHWGYFIPRFSGYGLVLGGLFGGLTYPVFGAFVGAPWGLAGGLILGLLMGIGVPIYNRYFAPDDADAYQLQLTFGAGMISILVMALPLLFIYALVAGMVTAYVSHHYAEDPVMRGEKRKHSMDMAQRREKVFTGAASAMMEKAKYFVPFGVIAAMLGYTAITFFDPFTFFRWAELIFIGIAGLIYGFLVASFVAAVNALFIVFANRLFFKPDTPKSVYKSRLVPVVGVLTLFLSMIVTAGIGAPFAAIAGALGASKYADWYYEFEDEEKAKRSSENLMDEDFEDGDYYPDEEDVMLVRERR